MIIIRRGQSNSSVAVGIVVVLIIVGLVGFGIYYFGFVKPAEEELEQTKDDAKRNLQNLNEITTSKAQEKVSSFLIRIRGADSKETVQTINQEINRAITLESKREELLNLVGESTDGAFHDLTSKRNQLIQEINGATSLSGLQDLEDTITGLTGGITDSWRNYHRDQINVLDNEVVMVGKNGSVYEDHMEKSEALEYLSNNSWKKLSRVKFVESNTYEVAVIDTLKTTSKVETGSRVDVYQYEMENGKGIPRVEDAKVIDIIYPKNVLSTISWNKSESTGTSQNTYSFTDDVWEEIKASEAGSDEAKDVWNNWAEGVVRKAIEDASLIDFDIQVVYVVEVSSKEVARKISKIEKFEQGQRDISIIPKK